MQTYKAFGLVTRSEEISWDMNILDMGVDDTKIGLRKLD